MRILYKIKIGGIIALVKELSYAENVPHLVIDETIVEIGETIVKKLDISQLTEGIVHIEFVTIEEKHYKLFDNPIERTK